MEKNLMIVGSEEHRTKMVDSIFRENRESIERSIQDSRKPISSDFTRQINEVRKSMFVKIAADVFEYQNRYTVTIAERIDKL